VQPIALKVAIPYEKFLWGSQGPGIHQNLMQNNRNSLQKESAAETDPRPRYLRSKLKI
jgi:hypothetical protein